MAAFVPEYVYTGVEMKNLTFEEMESVEKEERSKKPGIRIYPTYEIMFESDYWYCSYVCYGGLYTITDNRRGA